MMLMAKDHFEISTNVDINTNPDSVKKIPKYFETILNKVKDKTADLDVEIIDKKPQHRPWKTQLFGKDVKMVRFVWTGVGSSDDVKKWKQIWNEVEGMKGPCFFIHMNPNPLLRS